MAVRDQKDEAFANNPHTQAFTITDDDQTGSPKPPLDLTGRIAKWALTDIDPSTGLYSTTPLFEKKSTTAGQIVFTDSPAGKLDVNILPADTAGLAAADYYFELEIFDGSGLNGVVVATGTHTLFANVENT